MRKESAEDVAEAARRRLAALGRELARSGYPAASPSSDRTDEEAPWSPAVEQRAGERSVETTQPAAVVESVAWSPVVEQRACERSVETTQPAAVVESVAWSPVVEQRARERSVETTQPAAVVESDAWSPVVEQRARERSVETTPSTRWSDSAPSEGSLTPIAAPVPEPGRHARDRAATRSDRGVAWLQDRLPATVRGRVSLGAGHVAVLAVVASVALAVTAYATMRARPTVTAVPQAHTSSTAARSFATGGASPSAASATPAEASPTAGGTVVVDVAGKVRRPGVAALPAGSRVVDAIRKAGGARPGVDLSSLNLARVLVDGEQILVGLAAPPGVAASASSQSGAPSGDGSLVNLNTATLDQLDSLPGVGPVTAQKILDWRTAHGSFTAIDELLEVDGIGDKTLADMAPHLTL